MPNAVFTIYGLDELSKYLLRVSGSLQSKRLMAEIGLFLMTKIKLRTAKGVDYSETTFEDYSESYAAWREREGYQTERVDLFLTGSMMSSMTKTAKKDEVRLYFLNTEDKAGTKNPDKAAWLSKKREFFALNEKDIDEATGIVDDFIVNRMRR